MELNLNPTSNNTSQTKSTNDNTSDESNETPPRKSHNSLSFAHHGGRRRPTPEENAAAIYRECLKNHAAAIGGHAVDGCGEFMPPHPTSADSTSLRCAACGCHRNFHRREPRSPAGLAAITPPFIDFRIPHPVNSFSLSPSPPPTTEEKVASALKLFGAPTTPTADHGTTTAGPGGRKRFRTKFSQEQKEKMLTFAEKMGWKLQKLDEEKVRDFCSEIGITRAVLKVWMHNNKNTFAKNGNNAKDTILTMNSDQNDDDRNGNDDTGFVHHHPQTNGNDGRDI